ncbi:unannotated protein [freshwater metagenome]|uniref:Unannotated protein n=1 Tax=freshwater metagenome TaxID=449393 RepID=A0A6J7C144_9ZZZZ
MLAEHRVHHSVVTDERAGVGLGGARGELTGPGLEDHQLLAEIGGLLCRRAEYCRLADGLGEDADRGCVLVIEQVVNDVRDGDHRLVAGGDDETESGIVASCVSDHRGTHCAALGHQGERTGLDRHVQAEGAWGHAVPQVGESQMIRTQEYDPEVLGLLDKLALAAQSFGTFLGPTLAQDGCCSRASGHSVGECLGCGVLGGHQERAVDATVDVETRGHCLDAMHHWAALVHQRETWPGSEAVLLCEGAAGEQVLVAGADQGDARGPEEPVEQVAGQGGVGHGGLVVRLGVADQLPSEGIADVSAGSSISERSSAASTASA